MDYTREEQDLIWNIGTIVYEALQRSFTGAEWFTKTTNVSKDIVDELKRMYQNELFHLKQELSDKKEIIDGLRNENKHLVSKYKKTAVELGQEGEKSIMKYIEDTFTEATLTTTATEGGAGDFLLSQEDSVILIEVKNKHTLSSGDTGKFCRDVHNTNGCDAGLMISTQVGVKIPCKSHFQVEWVGNKPVMYVSEFDKHNAVLYVAVKALLFYLKKTDTQSLEEQLKTANEKIIRISPMVTQAKESISNAFRYIHDLENMLHDEISCVFSYKKTGNKPGRKRKINIVNK